MPEEAPVTIANGRCFGGRAVAMLFSHIDQSPAFPTNDALRASFRARHATSAARQLRLTRIRIAHLPPRNSDGPAALQVRDRACVSDPPEKGERARAARPLPRAHRDIQ